MVWLEALTSCSSAKGRERSEFVPGGFPATAITCKITNYHQPIGRIIDDFGHRSQVKNCLNWSCEAACRQRKLYSVMYVFSAFSMAIIASRINDCANGEY